MQIQVTVQGVKEIELNLRAGAHRAAHMRPGLVKVRQDMFRVFKATFTGQGRRYGGSWKALSPDWEQRKIRQGLDPRILIASGKLMDSFTKRESPYMRTNVTNEEIRISSTLSYAARQNEGDEEAGIPERRFIDFDQRDNERWAKMILTEMKVAFHAR